MASAKEYATDRIRNVAVLGHGGSGKTSLVESLCFVSGTSKRHGKPDDGTAHTMHTPEEHAHGISIQLTPTYAEHLDTKINLLDTPGIPGLHGRGALGGPGGGRRHHCGERHLRRGGGNGAGVAVLRRPGNPPDLFCLHDGQGERRASRASTSRSRSASPDRALPVEIPVGEGADFHGIINLFSEKAHLYKKGTATGEYDETDIPDEYKDREAQWETELQETLATTDERLLEAYLEGGHISREEAIEAMARGMARGEVFPVFCGSAPLTYGDPRPAAEDRGALPEPRPRRRPRRRTARAWTRTWRSTPPTTRPWPRWSSRPPPSPTWASCPSSASSPARSPTAWRW